MALVKELRNNLEYLTNDDGTFRVLMVDTCAPSFDTKALRTAMKEYKWRDGDFLLASYPKTGTHLCWEAMQMLLANSAEYIKYSKVQLMMDLRDLSQADNIFPSPRVLNSHYRLDVLPKQFRNRKTVLTIRNPKDTIVSGYYFAAQLHAATTNRLNVDVPFLSLDQFVDRVLHAGPEDLEYGSYFNYYEHMWNLAKDNHNILLLMYEDCVMKPKECVKKMDEFMGTNRDDKLIEEITDALAFDKMSKVKEHPAPNPASQSEEAPVVNHEKSEAPVQATPENIPLQVFRKGKVGDWKHQLNVAMNERIDEYLEKWPLASEIPFIYE